jgi:NAD(P) transhydrogenase subunit alpha
MARAFVMKESRPGETRVAASPESVKRLVKAGLEVCVEGGAGSAAGFEDAAFAAAGAAIGGAAELGAAELVLKVATPTPSEVERMKEGAVLVSFVLPSANPDVVQALCRQRISALAMDLVPRITRAQAMDALSSQATVAGYKAVLIGAAEMPVMCPLLMTAAGTVPPAKVVVFGAGVAGLQAIATAKRLGCKVEATDVRLAAKEQVESLGGKFIDVPGQQDLQDERGYAKEAGEDFLRRQREEVAKRVADANLVITTALIPGRPAPRLVSEEMLERMRPGAVVVDLAVESGGNCARSVAGEVVHYRGVKIVGAANLPASVPRHASELYARNVQNLVMLFVSQEEGRRGQLLTEFTDEVVAGCLLTQGGAVVHGKVPVTAVAAGKGGGA